MISFIYSKLVQVTADQICDTTACQINQCIKKHGGQYIRRQKGIKQSATSLAGRANFGIGGSKFDGKES